MSDKTLDSYTDAVRLHLKPSLGRKALRKLTVSDVDQLLAWKRSEFGDRADTTKLRTRLVIGELKTRPLTAKSLPDPGAG